MGGTPGIRPASEGRHGVSLVPSEGPFREGMPHQHGRTLGKRTVAAVAIDAGASVFGGRTSTGVSGQSAINRDPGNPGRRVGLHRGRNRRR